MADNYENNLWTFLNLEENDQQKLTELAEEIKSYTSENYLKLKLKIALQSTDKTILTILNIKDNDVLIKDTDSADLTLLKKKIVDKYALEIQNFNNLLTTHVELLKTTSDASVSDLLDYVEPKSNDKEDVRKKTLKILEGEPTSDSGNPYSKDKIINKFKELWNKNNDIYAKMASDYKSNVDGIFKKLQGDFERYIRIILRWGNDIDEDSRYKIINGFFISASLIILILGVRFGKTMKQKMIRILKRIKLLLRL